MKNYFLLYFGNGYIFYNYQNLGMAQTMPKKVIVRILSDRSS